MLRFADPRVLFLLLLIPLLAWRYLRRRRHGEGSLVIASTISLEGVRPSWTVRARHALFALNLIALTLVVVALARPQKGTEEEEILTEGVDIIVSLDVSGSMAAEDFLPRNRLAVAKRVIAQFVEGLRHDRVGLVVFAGKALTRCPLTLDYGVLLQVLDGIELGTMDDGTAIGNGLATSINRLRTSAAKSKVVVLVTDGVNNRGEVQPLDAAKIAQALAIKVYTVGVGTRGSARFPVKDRFGQTVYMNLPVEIDEESLTRIAHLTGGKYFRATDADSLQTIFDEIGRLEKTKIEVKTYTHYSERFVDLLAPALWLVAATAVASHTRLRKIP
jgi:Ca-activated chloride channel family protein